MSAGWQVPTQALVRDLQGIFGQRLQCLVAYGTTLGEASGPWNTLALLDSLSAEDLHACAHHARRWHREGLAIPLLLPSQEFRRSLDAFPLEYAEIQATHERVFGADPFDGVTIHAEDIRRACETQAKSHVLHLREGYLASHGNPGQVTSLVAASAPAFAALLRSVARLHQQREPAVAAATAIAGARAAGLDETIVEQVLSLEGPRAATVDGARLFPAYLAAAEQLARTVDTWHA